MPLTVSVAKSCLDNRCSATSVLDWRMQLNNFLQVNGGTGRLRYVDLASGPAHKPTWHCTAYSESEVLPRHVYLDLPIVDGVPYAEGRGGEKGEAREAAAYNCFRILCPQ